MIFTVEQVRGIRGGKITATLLRIDERIRPGSVRMLRRRVPASEDGEQPERVEPVTEKKPDGDETALVLTVLVVRDVEISALGFPEARPCGYRTPTELREHWQREHPRDELARFVAFELGDLRDLPRLISSGWPDYTNDPSRAMFGEPEAISREDAEWYGSYSWQQHHARRAQAAAEMAARPSGERLANILRRRR